MHEARLSGWFRLVKMNEVLTASDCRIEGEGIKGRPLVRWINKVHEYRREGGSRQGIEYAESDCWNGKLKMFLPWPHPWKEYP